MSAQLQHEPRIHLRRSKEPAVVTSPAPEDEGLTLLLADLTRGKTHGLRQFFENHCRNPEKMRPRTLWHLRLLRMRYEQQPEYHRLQLAAITKITERVPREIARQTAVPTKDDLKSI